MGLVTVKIFDNSVEARLFQARLQQEGIESYLFDENIISLDPLYNISVGGIKLKIVDKDIEAVKEVLLNIEHTSLKGENNEIIKCPNCNSTDLIAGYKTITKTRDYIAAFVSFLFLVFPLFFSTVYKCKECEEEFK